MPDMPMRKSTAVHWDLTVLPWRVGKSVGRTIYARPPGSGYRSGEILIGVMDTPELAAAAVEAHNAHLDGDRTPNEEGGSVGT